MDIRSALSALGLILQAGADGRLDSEEALCAAYRGDGRDGEAGSCVEDDRCEGEQQPCARCTLRRGRHGCGTEGIFTMTEGFKSESRAEVTETTSN